MTIKNRTREGSYSPRRAHRATHDYEFTQWCPLYLELHEHLDQPEITDLSFLESEESEDPPDTRVVTQEHLETYDSRFLHYNPCVHRKLDSSMSRGKIALLGKHYVDETWPCDPPPGHKAWWYHKINHRLSFTMDRVLWPEAIPVDITQECDPYLDVSSDLFKSKSKELDAIALDFMIPKLDTGFSVPVFLFELFELKFLFKDVTETLFRLPRRIKNLMKKPLKEISESYLSAIFGWLPLVRDVKMLTQKFLEADKIVTAFLDRSDTRMTLHFQKALSPLTFQPMDFFDPQVLDDISIDTGGPRDDWYFAEDVFHTVEFTGERARWVTKLVYHATMDFEYKLPELSGYVRLMAELDHYGMNLSISDVWEVIPFSFVVDWVLNVGRWLEQFDKTNVPVQVVVYDFCRSFKYRLEERYRLKDVVDVRINSYYDQHSCDWTTPSKDLYINTYKSYYRDVGIPIPTQEQLPNFRFPSGKQWVTAGALLGVRT